MGVVVVRREEGKGGRGARRTITVTWGKEGAGVERRGWGVGTMIVTGSEEAWGKGGDQRRVA